MNVFSLEFHLEFIKPFFWYHFCTLMVMIKVVKDTQNNGSRNHVESLRIVKGKA